jgi:predicted small secreted protein
VNDVCPCLLCRQGHEQAAMKKMRIWTALVTAVLLVAAFYLTSCAVVTKDGAVMMGGKGAAKGGSADGNWAMVWNGENSFREAVRTGAAVAAGYFALGAQEATEATNQVAARQATARHGMTQKTIQNGQNVHGAAYGGAVKAEVPGLVAPLPPVAPAP